MKNFIAEDKKIVSGKGKKIHAAQAAAPDEDLQKLLRRAVKSVSVPADLKSKVWNLLRKQS